ncbi:MAG TPA: hypothetical protein VJA94_00100 [Candidatus Angelobacter sp.]
MFAVSVVYCGLAGAFLGTVSLIKPLWFVGIPSRGRALLVIVCGLLVVVIGCLLPARETRVDPLRTRLDEFMPVYQFHEFHSIRISASKEQVYKSIKAVTADEILFFRTLIWIRRFGRSGPESILNPSKNTPLLDIATRTTFILLADEPNRELVLGTVVGAPPGWRRPSRATSDAFKAVHAPGFALAAMNFLIEEDGPGACTLTTETRIFVTDASTRRRFAAYWRVIYPGSALIRRMWLRAIKKRAAAQLR